MESHNHMWGLGEPLKKEKFEKLKNGSKFSFLVEEELHVQLFYAKIAKKKQISYSPLLYKFLKLYLVSKKKMLLDKVAKASCLSVGIGVEETLTKENGKVVLYRFFGLMSPNSQLLPTSGH